MPIIANTHTGKTLDHILLLLGQTHDVWRSLLKNFVNAVGDPDLVPSTSPYFLPPYEIRVDVIWHDFTTDPAPTLFENHREMVEVQVCLSGRETIYLVPHADMLLGKPYSPEQDVQLFAKPRGVHPTQINLCRSSMVILFPGDGHLPLQGTPDYGQLLKLVAKVPVEYCNQPKF